METAARLQSSPYPPRKMRLLADLIRGVRADKALYILELNEKRSKAKSFSKLLRSAIANWQQQNGDTGADITDLFVKTVTVDKGRMLKRVQPAPQGRAHRVRKRFSHVKIVLGSLQETNTESLAN